MIQVRRWIPMHADLAWSMFLRFPVQSRSMRGFRTFHVKPQFAYFPAFHAKPQPGCFPAFHAKLQVACFRTFASHANAVSGKCAFPSSAAPVESSFPCECCSRGVCLPGECACAAILQTRGLFRCLYVRICPVTGALP